MNKAFNNVMTSKESTLNSSMNSQKSLSSRSALKKSSFPAVANNKIKAAGISLVDRSDNDLEEVLEYTKHKRNYSKSNMLKEHKTSP